jgi:hypothetical protein
LWCEKPLYAQADFIFRTWKAMADADPSLALQQPYKAIGSGPTLEYRDGAVYRTAGLEQPVDDGPGKAIHIWMRTGRRPLLAGGNADGDIEMLSQARFALLVDHDDAEREFEYRIGAEKALAAANAGGWTVVSMKHDWSRVF